MSNNSITNIRRKTNVLLSMIVSGIIIFLFILFLIFRAFIEDIIETFVDVLNLPNWVVFTAVITFLTVYLTVSEEDGDGEKGLNKFNL